MNCVLAGLVVVGGGGGLYSGKAPKDQIRRLRKEMIHDRNRYARKIDQLDPLISP